METGGTRQQPTFEARQVPLAVAANELPRDPSLPAALLSHLLLAPISRMAERTSSDPPKVHGYLLVGGWALLKFWVFFGGEEQAVCGCPWLQGAGDEGDFLPK